MKTMTISKTNHPNVIPFPNALSRRQAFCKLLDTLVVTVSGVGISAMLAFLLAMG